MPSTSRFQPCPSLPRLLCRLPLFARLAAVASVASLAAAPASSPSADEALITLDAFTVSTARDVGFVAKESLAGGRMNNDLADTPVAYSVQTREFLDALNLSDLIEAQQWAPNVVATPDDGGDSMFGGTGVSTVRGLTANAQQKNFYSAAPSLQGGMNFDAYNLERLDFTRGPNSILFGTGGMGGTSNAVSKVASTHRRRTEIRAESGAWNHRRTTFDHNQPLSGRLALRLNAMWQRSEGWRDFEYVKKTGFAPAITFDYDRDTRIMLSGEYTQSRSQQPFSSLVDAVSAWDGVTTYSGRQTANQLQFGATRLADNSFIYVPSLGTDQILNWGRLMITSGASSNPTSAGGVTVPAGVTGVGYSGTPLLYQQNAPSNLFQRAIEGARGFYVRQADDQVYWNDVGNAQRFRNLTLQVDRRLGDRFLVQLAGDIAKRKAWGNVTEWSGASRALIDINRTLPTGEPNPNFLVPYIESSSGDRQYQLIDSRAVRASVAYVHRTRWVDVKCNLMGAVERYENFTNRLLYVLPWDPDPRVWGASLSNTKRIARRLYWNETPGDLSDLGEISAVDPISGVTRTMTPVWALSTARPDVIQSRSQEAKYFQAAANLSFFKKRWIVMGALRVDRLAREVQYSRWAYDYPEGYYSDTTPLYRPDAPENYYQLTYLPKNAQGQITSQVPLQATTRPRTDGVPAAQYANDRFQDDFNPPKQKFRKQTPSIGTILNLSPAIALWGNFAQTFNPIDANFPNMDFSLASPSLSRGYDYGIRCNLGGGRVMINLSRYQSKESNVSFRVQEQNMNTIIRANAIGDNSADGMNRRGLSLLPITDYYNTRDYKADGYEFEIVGNITASWRVTANGSLASAKQTNAYRELVGYFRANEATLRAILGDAGVSVSSSGVASVTTTGSPDGTGSANAWNNFQNTLKTIVTGAQDVNRLTRHTANVYSDYRFARGWSKGLRLGVGLQFRGPQVIGYRGADTIVDPANPARSVDNPDVDAYTTVEARSYYLGTLTLGYPLKAFRHTIDLNLSISNLFNYRQPQYVSTAMRPPGGSVLDPSRVATPSTFSLVAPRGFKLAASYAF